jgi:hypothetical protein
MTSKPCSGETLAAMPVKQGWQDLCTWRPEDHLAHITEKHINFTLQVTVFTR